MELIEDENLALIVSDAYVDLDQIRLVNTITIIAAIFVGIGTDGVLLLVGVVSVIIIGGNSRLVLLIVLIVIVIVTHLLFLRVRLRGSGIISVDIVVCSALLFRRFLWLPVAAAVADASPSTISQSARRICRSTSALKSGTLSRANLPVK